MIFVTVGTGEQPFDRLLRGVEALAVDEPILVQHGSSAIRPVGADYVEFMPFMELSARMRQARAVITHAGVGSIMTALNAGKRPVVVPRQRRFGEAVDDHQAELARRLGDSDLVVVVEDVDRLAAALSESSESSPSFEAETNLVTELRAYLMSCARPTESVEARS